MRKTTIHDGSGRPDARFHDQPDADLAAGVRNCSGAVTNTADELGGWPDLPVQQRPPELCGDGMLHAWEQVHRPQPDDASDTWVDRDGDGRSNIGKHTAVLAGETGLDPR